jgi:hypothetical protein
MGGFFNNLSANARVQAVLLGWAMPSLLVSFAFVLLVLPEVDRSAVVKAIGTATADLDVSKTLFVFLVTVALASVMFLNRVLLYRILEGITWPAPLRRWRVAHIQQPHRDYLVAQRDHTRFVHQREEAQRVADARWAAAESTGKDTPAYRAELDSWLKDHTDKEAELAALVADAQTERYRRARALRKRATHFPRRGKPLLPRRGRPLCTPMQWRRTGAGSGAAGLDVEVPLPYPQHRDQVMATRVGNALRRIETYGVNHFGLDTQIMWYELYSLTPDGLRADIDDAEMQADTLVCSLYGIAALTATAVAGGVWRVATGVGGVRLWITAAACLVALVVVHHALLTAIEEWGVAIQAMVTTGRGALREKFGLKDPDDPADERDMWSALVGTVWYGDEASRQKLNAFKTPQEQATRQCVSES